MHNVLFSNKELLTKKELLKSRFDKESDIMAKIASFILCDSITNIPGPPNISVPQLNSPQIALRPPFIPGAISFGIAVGVNDFDLTTTNRIRFTITNPDGKEIQNSGDAEFGPLPITDSMPQQYQGFILSTDIRNLEIIAEGVYVFSLFVNGEVAGTCEIPVFKRSEQK